MAIDSLKMLVPLFLDLIFYSVSPTWFQIAGITFCVVGASVVSIYGAKKDTKVQKKDDDFTVERNVEQVK